MSVQNYASPVPTALKSGGALSDRFRPVTECWICGDHRLRRAAPLWLDFDIYREQDPELAEYTGETVWLNRCAGCGFMQPAGLPALPNFFARMYDTRWSPDWVADEFSATYREPIFETVLRELDRRVKSGSKRLLDIGAHVGKLVHTAARAGWDAEGVELNPTTAAYAAKRTGRPIHCCSASELAAEGRAFDAVTILDVLEHIPQPVPVLTALWDVLAPGGWLALKVPCGINQFRKEQVCALLRPGHRINLANNLVHVNHFTPQSLTAALQRAGFTEIEITIGAPERFPMRGRFDLAGMASRRLRSIAYQLGSRLPGGVHTPLALNLQAYARRPSSSAK